MRGCAGVGTPSRSRRRRFLFAAAAWIGLACAGTAPAQSPAKIARIGYLSYGAGPAKAFQQGLRELGYIEGKNILVEYRFAHERAERLPALAAELVKLDIAVLVAPDPPAYQAAVRATRTIPIVMRSSTDPVAEGVAASLARPGGNVTGVYSLYSALIGKRMEVLKEAAPSVSRVLVLFNPKVREARNRLAQMEKLSAPLGLQLLPQEVQGAADFERAFMNGVREGANGLLLIRNPVLAGSNVGRIASLAAKFRLPAVYDAPAYVDAGGLMSYGADLRDITRYTATYVDKILKGAKAAELPIEQATKVELLVNMRAARSLGITIPQSILLRADRVIE